MSKIRANFISSKNDNKAVEFTSGIVVGGAVTATNFDFNAEVYNVGTGASISNPVNNELALGTNNTEKVRITSAGLVGIGTDAPNEELHIHANGTSYVRFTDETSGISPTNGVVLGLDHPHLYAWNYEAGDFVVASGGNSKFTVKNSGDAQIADGNLKIMTSGHGIDFSATGQATGMSNELLDDYEEGTWTPTPNAAGGGGTWTTIEGFTAEYIKVGSLVSVTMFFTQIYYTGTPLSYLQISGLPFAKKPNSFAQGPCVITNVNFGTNSYVVAEPTNTTIAADKCYFKIVTNNSGGSDLQANLFSSSSATLRFTMTYRTE